MRRLVKGNANLFGCLYAIVMVMAFLVGLAAHPVRADQKTAPYDVRCETSAEGKKACLVDKTTYIGWRTYSANCLRCHGQDAVGSTFAPSLVERLQVIDRERFVHAVAEGYTGQIGVMPPWKDNPNVSKHYDKLYGYLKARADGILPPGRPKRFDR